MPPRREPPPALVLFDIDGTLIRRIGPSHRNALIYAVRRVTGLETSVDGIPLHGMLDPEILSTMMTRAGASRTQIRQAMPRIQRCAEAWFSMYCPNLERKVCPGVRPLLRRLKQLSIPLGLVTGNFERIGWKKIERAGLKPYFQLAACAGMAPDRAALVKLAVREARRRGWIGRHTSVTLIGDTPRDVQAARTAGVRSVAVATGICTRQELEASSPDLLVDDLRQLPLDALLAS